MEDDTDPGGAPPARFPAKPSTLLPSSIFLAYIADILDNLYNQKPNGALRIELDSIRVIQHLMDMEVKRINQMEKCMDCMLSQQDCIIKN